MSLVTRSAEIASVIYYEVTSLMRSCLTKLKNVPTYTYYTGAEGFSDTVDYKLFVEHQIICCFMQQKVLHGKIVFCD